MHDVLERPSVTDGGDSIMTNTTLDYSGLFNANSTWTHDILWIMLTIVFEELPQYTSMPKEHRHDIASHCLNMIKEIFLQFTLAPYMYLLDKTKLLTRKK